MSIIKAILMLLVISMGPGIAEVSEGEPEKLSELRTSWKNAKTRASQPIRTSYLNALIRLRDKLTRQEKLEDAVLVQDEISELTNNATAEVDIPEKEKDSKLPELVQLRATYQREMAEMIRKNDGIYQKALLKLKTTYAQAGELESTLAVTTELEQFDQNKAEESGFCKLEVRTKARIKAFELKKGVARLSGGFRPIFEKVDDSLSGQQFLRVPWKSKPAFKIKALTDGTIYILAPNPKSFKASAPKKKVDPLITGPWLGKSALYLIHLEKGQEFSCNGFECTLIAKKFVIKQ